MNNMETTNVGNRIVIRYIISTKIASNCTDISIDEVSCETQKKNIYKVCAL